MASKTQSPRGNQNKGKEGERQVIKILQPVVNEVFAAHGLDPPILQRNTLQSDRGGCDLCGLEWLALEVKRQEDLAVPAWWRQTVEQAGRAKEPVLWYRRNNEAWKVVVRVNLWPIGGQQVQAVATVDPDTFIRWFRQRLNWELGQ